ncbi:hypothetical protein AAF712_003853 [Marasmius tenuissimus]|uniref:Extracellular membrane protein CFEM domain-containing protein n=1 Tax=Marasmius tenuissimus TaxID=585030 RepID=A0ABR3A5E4_9AGAR|nr:hypothetical protein PM082_016995 [Marasmius tenuissimus]
MRSFLILSALAIASVTAHVGKRQEEATGTPETSTTIVDSSSDASHSTSASSTASGSADPCLSPCDSASVVYSSCHNEANSLACFCQSRSINTLAACASCRRTNSLNDEAEALEEQIGGIIAACNSQSSTVAPPTGVTITKTATLANPSQITAPPAARISSASASGSKASSASKSGASSSPSGGATANNNGASAAFGVAGGLAGIVGAGALALFI